MFGVNKAIVSLRRVFFIKNPGFIFLIENIVHDQLFGCIFLQNNSFYLEVLITRNETFRFPIDFE